MKMAKPSERDIDAGGKLLGILDLIDRKWLTDGPQSLDGLEDDFDPDKLSHLQALYNELAALLQRAPNFHGRVLGGMCYAICYDKNAILDPASDCLDLHPNIVAGLRLLRQHRTDFLPNLEREARSALAAHIEESAAKHLAAMRASWAPKELA